MLRRTLALVSNQIAACEGINDKTPSLSLPEDRNGAMAIFMGRGLGANTGIYTRLFGVQFPGAPSLNMCNTSISLEVCQ
jgi:hypothetical protein